MQTYQTRVIEEKWTLEEKSSALYAFLSSKHFTALSNKEQLLLKQQYYVMQVYVGILEQRIELFE